MQRLILLLLFLKGSLMAIEEPAYQVIQKNEIYEVRTYAPFIVAQTEVSGNFDAAGNKAFRILFNYISGENQQRENIQMTAPVIQKKSNANGIKIDMTAPVIQQMDENKTEVSIYSFVMPDSFTLATLPEPLDKRVTLKQIPPRTVAVLEYSGSWSEKRYKEKESILLKALADDGINIIGKPEFARYNSPFSLWFLRRNEILIQIEYLNQ